MAATSDGVRAVLIAAAMAAGACSRPAPASTATPPPRLSHHRAEFDADTSLSRNAIPRFEPSYVAKCPIEGPVDDIMKTVMSPSLARISMNLYHADAPAEERLSQVADATAKILGCFEQLIAHRDLLRNEDWGTFDHFLWNMVVNVHALQIAAIESDDEWARHWYVHLKQSCAACHARFAPPG